MAKHQRPPRSPADARRRAGQRPVPSTRKPAARQPGSGIEHLLSAVAGAMVGLVAYSLLTPGYLPDGPPDLADPAVVGKLDKRNDLRIIDLAQKRSTDGYTVVGGRVRNQGSKRCERAVIKVLFLDDTREVTSQMATFTGIEPGATLRFEVRAYAPKANAVNAVVDLAQF